nr:N-succinylarginine dihydrolase [Oceanisphaera avium]
MTSNAPLTSAVEVNFDGLVGPTHHYAGLAYGNLASQGSAQSHSNPKQAALQGLQKMKSLHDLGLYQGVLAPQDRPAITTLRKLGFSGTDAQVLEKVYRYDPNLLAACSSASSMWAANAATVSSSLDTPDKRVHFTPANLNNKFHRSIEHPLTGKILGRVFSDEAHFCHHLALPNHDAFGDEGAANHTRLCGAHQQPGLALFVYGRHAFNNSAVQPQRYPARQTKEASQAIARLHGLTDANTLFVAQNPQVIDRGVFHNDVIAVGNENLFFYHQAAFAQPQRLQADIQQKLANTKLHFIEVSEAQVPLQDAISSYLFNSQIVTLACRDMLLIAPKECAHTPSIQAYLTELLSANTPLKGYDIWMLIKACAMAAVPPVCACAWC